MARSSKTGLQMIDGLDYTFIGVALCFVAAVSAGGQ
jgi:hypothetical protein